MRAGPASGMRLSAESGKVAPQHVQSGISANIACTQQFNDYFACLNQNIGQICDSKFEGCATQTAAFDGANLPASTVVAAKTPTSSPT